LCRWFSGFDVAETLSVLHKNKLHCDSHNENTSTVMLKSGTITTWKDDRGFGFIKPEDDSKEVFLHISEVKGLSRRPRIGDVVFYEPRSEADGKVRATKVSIQGVGPRTQAQGESSGILEKIVSGIIALIALIGFGAGVTKCTPSRSPSPITAVTKPNCQIKGNISVSSGNKIYHLPGMED
jgi:cold shock CspA family protein